jgi:hypothetical protein
MAASTLPISAQATPEDLFQRNEQGRSTSTAPSAAGLQWLAEELSNYLRMEHHLSSAGN